MSSSLRRRNHAAVCPELSSLERRMPEDAFFTFWVGVGISGALAVAYLIWVWQSLERERRKHKERLLDDGD